MERIINIARDIKELGGTAVLVGGIVRDMILGRESKDIDIEVFGVTPDALQNVLSNHGNVKFVGQAYGVFNLDNHIDIAMPRRERKSGVGYKGFEVSVDPNMSFEEAAMRRDLTMNAIMFDPIEKIFIDPHGGMDDLRAGIIKHVNPNTFAEDPLRVLRVAQFSARFEFDVHEDTVELARTLVHELQHLSKERIMIELEKMLMKASRPSIAFRFLDNVGALNHIMPELAVLRGIGQGTVHHAEDVFEHTMMAVDSIPVEKRTLDVMLGILLHDVGKAEVEIGVEDNGNIVHFFGHAEEGVNIAENFLARFTAEQDLTESVKNLVKYHMRFYDIRRDMHKRHIRRLALKVDLDKLLLVHTADLMGRAVVKDLHHIDAIASVWDEVRNEIKPIVMGRHLIEVLGLMPSKKFGAILKHAFDKQLDGEFTDLAGGLEVVRQHLEESA